jgi:hypothetical protein
MTLGIQKVVQKSVNNGTRGPITPPPPPCRKVPLIQVLYGWIAGTADYLDCKIFLLETGFLYAQALFKTGFAVLTSLSKCYFGSYYCN